ncbi:helix-turn-helix domain-containing protein [Georgenia sp. Z1491]|uniref:AraC family transcriptional regulator n=1 Tax=Georgenia sp. Z1491 TaxID=3416707 RepID=UPI003CF0E448
MTDLTDGRGILYPARLPTFHRAPVPADLGDRVRWFWVPRWRLSAGRVSRQRILPYPASNLVVGPDGVTLAGPTTGVSHRDLVGTGWAVGALLRPAGLAALADDPRTLRDVEADLDLAGRGLRELYAEVVEAMADPDEDAGRYRAVAALADWVGAHLPPPDAAGRTANAMEDLVATDPDVVRVEQVAEQLGLSVRAVQRVARRYVGLPPLAIVRRYRLQEAARRLREEPGLGIADVAADLGYADHAHLSADFRTVLGLTPSEYRRTRSGE